MKAATLSGRRIHYVDSLHRNYGPFVRLSPTEVAANDVQGFKQIYGINSGFTKSPWYREMTAEERPGVFTMIDPKEHAARRRLFARPFSKTHLREHWEAAVRDKVDLAILRIREESSSVGIADILKWFTFFASDVSAHLMFGESFRTLERGETSKYIITIQKALKGSGIGYEMPIVRQIGRLLPLKSTQELFGTADYVISYAKIAVDNMKASQGSKNIFANLMAEAGKGHLIDERDVQLEASNFIVAGTDTTAITLTYLVWAVLSKPALQLELEGEVAALPDAYRDADIENLKLLGAVVHETLRLYSAAPGMLLRIVPPNGTIIGGYLLPASTTATTQSYSLHRDPDLFPEPHQ